MSKHVLFVGAWLAASLAGLAWGCCASAFVALEWLWPWEYDSLGRSICVAWVLIASPVIALGVAEERR